MQEGYGVVWWDPRALTLSVPQSFGIRQEELLKESNDPAVVKKDLESYQAWTNRWNSVRQRATLPTLDFRTATAQARLESYPAEFECAVHVIELPRDPGRPAGARFGSLVHATLAAVPLDASPIQIQQATSLYARVLGANTREAEAARTVVQTVLNHPEIGHAREAAVEGRCRRETPVTVTLADGSIVEGVLDLAFFSSDTWTVVDFKTDRELEKELAHYKRQLGLYSAAISRSTSKSTAGILMFV
jgi:ATP-dependent exoDNAse (exonuclease V) beta subunit